MEINSRHPKSLCHFLINTVLVLVGGSFVANAYIGETAEDLRGPNGKYGVPTSETSPKLKVSQDRVDIFKNNSITVEYDAEGKAWRVSYKKKNLGDDAIDVLLERNASGMKWSKPVMYRGNRHWITDNGKVHAVYYGAPLFKLVVMTDEAAKAERRVQSLATVETKPTGDPNDVDTDPGKKPEKKGKDPLEGF